jgi:tRNA(Ile)-lysidine synthase
LKPTSARKRNLSVLVAEPRHSNIFSSLNGLSRLALAVSGGSDSMAMLRMVQEWAQRDTEIFVLTVDHGLRMEAGREAAQVAVWCASRGLVHKTLHWKHGGISAGMQAKARVARYDLMTAWCLEHDVPALLTGHTADDQAETVAMRMERTETAASLAGIWPELDWNGIRVLRPLLSMRRQELRDYLKTLGQGWIDDPSNENTRFERVRVRQALGGALHDLDLLATDAQRTVTRLNDAAVAWCSTHFLVHETGFLTINRGEISKLEDAVLDLVLQKICNLCSPGGPGTELEDRIALAKWLRQPAVSRRTLGGVVFAKRQAALIAGREPGRISLRPTLVPRSGVVIWDQRFEIRAPAGCEALPVGSLDQLPRRRDIPAFVQSGLPAVRNASGLLAIPHLNIGGEVSVKFLRH